MNVPSFAEIKFSSSATVSLPEYQTLLACGSVGMSARATAHTILIVDDDPSIRRWLARSLEINGFAVLAVEDLAGARSTLDEVPVDAMIVDLHLGEESGVELLDFVRSRTGLARMPILVLTGITQMSASEEQAITRHGAYVFYKPASSTEIAATLRREISSLP